MGGLSSPAVSVVVPVFNGQAWIERSLRSALAQTSRSLEVIVTDDGCTDNTPAILATLASQERRVRLLRTSGRLGPAAARNLALDAARGTWIAFLDADDRFHPERLERLLAAAHDENAVLLADNQCVLTEDGRPDGLLWPWITQRRWVDALSWVEHNAWYGAARFGYGYAKVMVRRELLESPRLRMRPELQLMEDYHFVLALLRRGHELLLLPEPMYDYTLRAGSMTHATAETVLGAVLSVGEEVMHEVEPGPLQAALKRQQASVEWRAVRFQVLGRLKARDLPGAMRLLAHEPAALPYVLQSLGQALARRMHPRRG
ncbi:MAG TPA: glycosyltransferase family 2 protein [Ramlibacter sp.]|nr:glycosyltransferase family 2 protein [Ramlibacter sp.]